MNVKLDITGLDQLNARIPAMVDRMSDMNPLIQRISVMELASAQGRIEAGGPGWPPTAENSSGTSLNRTGALLRSLTRGMSGNLWTDIPGGLRVGTSLQTEDGYNIGTLMQYGTGIYGRGTPIIPVAAKMLAFQLNGRTIFAHKVVGVPPRRFLYISDDDAARALQMAAAFVRGQQGDA